MRIGLNLWSLVRRHLVRCALAAVLALHAGAAFAGLAEECSALFERGNQYYRKGDYPHAVETLERAAQIAERAFGTGSPNVGLVYNSLSTAYLAQGRYNDAEPFLLRALQIRGHAVPDDVAIIGWDANELGATTVPSLTTVAPDMPALVTTTVDVLIGRISGSDEPAREITVGHHLLIRESAPPAGTDPTLAGTGRDLPQVGRARPPTTDHTSPDC